MLWLLYMDYRDKLAFLSNLVGFNMLQVGMLQVFKYKTKSCNNQPSPLFNFHLVSEPSKIPTVHH